MSGNALIGRLCRVPVESLSSPCRVPVESLSRPCISEWEGSDNVESLSSTCRILVEYLSDTCRVLHQKGTKRYKKVSQGITYHTMSHYHIISHNIPHIPHNYIKT